MSVEMGLENKTDQKWHAVPFQKVSAGVSVLLLAGSTVIPDQSVKDFLLQSASLIASCDLATMAYLEWLKKEGYVD